MLAVAQAVVLVSVVPRLRIGVWVAATCVGQTVVWATALIPMLYGTTVSRWAPSAQTPTVAVTGLMIIYAVGVAQWLVLRRCCDRAGLWIWANGVGWVVGLTAFAVVATPLGPSGPNGAAIVPISVAGCFVTAVAVAAITGAFLSLIVSPRRRTVPPARAK
ncbi:hypothetical protein [Nocardia vaccinii]|uniref:hypothetical protein n=1 Tax=Nocardia vaccinii TaxID=1822 RepID=UPI000AE1CA74|nr:hypothetical protein [Nocardia vaccinii]